MNHQIKLIAFDLDGTLLNSEKQLSSDDADTLARAANAGIEIVPATGRFLAAIPAVIRELPFVRYFITVNGAQIFDARRNFSISRSEIPLEQALWIMRYLDTLPVFYDCFLEDWGWMNRAHYERIEEFAADAHYLQMLRDLRRPVDDLKAFLAKKGRSVQKIQLFTLPRDAALRLELLKKLPLRFPGTAVSSSVVNNIEINSEHATKGEALRKLADYLGLSLSRTLAFGDGLNDLSLIQTAGIGVAMRNAYPEIQAAADFVTLSCEESGVAAGIKKFCEEI